MAFIVFRTVQGAPPPSGIGLQTNEIWFLGDDAIYYKFGLVNGAWTGPLDSRSSPIGQNFGDVPLTGFVAILGDDGFYHQFAVTGDPGAWTDTSQVDHVSNPLHNVGIARFDTALYLAGTGTDTQYHKFQVIGQTWVDSAQGSLPPF